MSLTRNKKTPAVRPADDDASARAGISGTAIVISPEGEAALRRELGDLLEERQRQLPRRLRNARDFGAATENDEYLQILEEEAIISARIRSIQAILASARVVAPGDGDPDVAEIGSTVLLQVIGGAKRRRRLLGAHEPIGDDGVSAASPIGQAVLGARSGDTISVDLPNGNRVMIEILDVQRSGSSLPELAPAA